MIDVVGAEARADELLEQVGLLVGRLGRAESGERVGAVTVADVRQAAGGARERLLPRGGPEMRRGIGGIDAVVGTFPDAILADQRLSQPVRVAHVVEAEPALDAKPVLVRGAVAAAHRDDPVVLDVVGDETADAAERADTVDAAVRRHREDVALVEHGGRHQRPGRAGLDALAAGNAGRGPHRVAEVEHDLLRVAAPRHADHVVDLHLAAGAHAETAMDAGVEVDGHGRMAAVGGGRVSRGRRPCVTPWRPATFQSSEKGSCARSGAG